jgi:hypothetical protein
MRDLFIVVLLLAISTTLLADPMNCDLAQHRTMGGLSAIVEQDTLVVTWTGEGSVELRAISVRTAG